MTTKKKAIKVSPVEVAPVVKVVPVVREPEMTVDHQAEFTREVSFQGLHFRAGQRVMVHGISSDKVKVGKNGLFWWVSKSSLKAV